MDELPPDCEIVFRTRERDECLESRLVLAAAGISAETQYRDGWWRLVVNRGDRADAAAELEAYRQENLVPTRRDTAVPVYGGAAWGVLVYAGIIILVGVLAAPGTLGHEWQLAGRMQADRVMAGQWWRIVTALTLHLDLRHVAGNLVFGVLFGFLAGRVLGGGVAWLTIVVAAALGNLMNAIVQPPSHSSIGASTAVFAALGVIVSHALRPRTPVAETPLRRWSPLIGGILLLAFIGMGGERTDVVSHLTGFLAGLLIGWAGCRLPNHWLASRQFQKWTGFAAIAIVAFAWIIGLVMVE